MPPMLSTSCAVAAIAGEPQSPISPAPTRVAGAAGAAGTLSIFGGGVGDDGDGPPHASDVPASATPSRKSKRRGTTAQASQNQKGNHYCLTGAKGQRRFLASSTCSSTSFERNWANCFNV